MTHTSAEPVTFIVTDIETDGHSPLRNSMLSFASVAVTYDGTVHGEFESVLARRPDRQPDPRTMEWWQGFPEAYAAATENPQDPQAEMLRFADWVESIVGNKVFCAAPVMFDGPWMDHYLDTFAETRALGGPYAGRQLFRGGGVCLTQCFELVAEIGMGVRVEGIEDQGGPETGHRVARQAALASRGGDVAPETGAVGLLDERPAIGGGGLGETAALVLGVAQVGGGAVTRRPVETGRRRVGAEP